MQQRRALAIDDDKFCLELLSEILIEQQFEVDAFPQATCNMTIQEADCCPMEVPCYDVLLTDNQMPGMTGLDFLELQRCNGCKIPAHRKAIISGYWTTDDLGIAAQIGCQVFHKPYALELIGAWLDVSQKKD